jgi:hypothetical protein
MAIYTCLLGNEHAAIEELLEAVFSVGSALGTETEFRRIRHNWSLTVASQ